MLFSVTNQISTPSNFLVWPIKFPHYPIPPTPCKRFYIWSSIERPTTMRMICNSPLLLFFFLFSFFLFNLECYVHNIFITNSNDKLLFVLRKKMLPFAKIFYYYYCLIFAMLLKSLLNSYKSSKFGGCFLVWSIKFPQHPTF